MAVELEQPKAQTTWRKITTKVYIYIVSKLEQIYKKKILKGENFGRRFNALPVSELALRRQADMEFCTSVQA